MAKCEHCVYYAPNHQSVRDYDAPRRPDGRPVMKMVATGLGTCRAESPKYEGFPRVSYDDWCRVFTDRVP